jgi:hypothetical protein
MLKICLKPVACGCHCQEKRILSSFSQHAMPDAALTERTSVANANFCVGSLVEIRSYTTMNFAAL